MANSFLSVISLLLAATFNFIPSSSCPQHQKEALLKFKSLFLEQTNQHKHESLDTWDPYLDCCKWERIECNSSSFPQQVTHLEIGNINLPLPSSGHVLTSDVLSPVFQLRTLTVLDIRGNAIQGKFPGHGLANLTELVYLSISKNLFHGPLPPQLFALTKLEELPGYQNLFDGAIPKEIANLTKLNLLYLSYNLMTGEIPTEIGSLSSLKFLYLDNNGFSGQVRGSVSNLSNLVEIYLGDNLLTGNIPSSIRNMSTLEDLELSNNFLSGYAPMWLFDMQKLSRLYLGGNLFTWTSSPNKIIPRNKFAGLSLRSSDLSGKIPSWLANQTNLYRLDLSENNLEGSIPLWLAELEAGCILLSDNKLTGPLPPRLFHSRILSYLSLSRNKLSGHLPNNIGESSTMKILMLSDNHFSGPIPESFSNMSELLLMDLSGNRFSGSKFPVLSTIRSLLQVYLSSNLLCGEIPATFPPTLQVLVLSQNNFSGPIPRNLTKLLKLKYIDFHDNNITGRIPKSLVEMHSLQLLNLRNNSLVGPIPDRFSSLSSLQILDLSNNKLSGSIPSSLGNLSKMINNHNPLAGLLDSIYITSFFMPWDSHEFHDVEIFWKNLKQHLSGQNLHLYTFLDLSGNQLSGHIPDTFSELRSLKSLNLSHNKLSGQIPKRFGYLQSLESLDLSHNNLSGEIPKTFSEFQQLAFLDLSNNKLQGPIPGGPQMDRLNDPSFYANNGGLCGMQIQAPCTKVGTKQEKNPGESTDWNTWLWWEMAVVGYFVGLSSTILFMYAIGFFKTAPKSCRR